MLIDIEFTISHGQIDDSCTSSELFQAPAGHPICLPVFEFGFRILHWVGNQVPPFTSLLNE